MSTLIRVIEWFPSVADFIFLFRHDQSSNLHLQTLSFFPPWRAKIMHRLFFSSKKLMEYIKHSWLIDVTRNVRETGVISTAACNWRTLFTPSPFFTQSFLSLEIVSFNTSSLDNICFTTGVCVSGKHVFCSS